MNLFGQFVTQQQIHLLTQRVYDSLLLKIHNNQIGSVRSRGRGRDGKSLMQIHKTTRTDPNDLQHALSPGVLLKSLGDAET